ncbi:MAG TPA: LuxR C-terminal-related transcriptional regulator [Ktedonobacteraceae bacterium]|nr:LuxR C-terminal-related transcriptional regulator [Ktedonobacteraceae bacterium]
MAHTTPRVEQETLVLPAGQSAPVEVGSQQWYSWLSDEGNSSFFFVNEAGSFTARKEKRARGGWYWIAYRSRGGKLAKTYIGRSEDLTFERLCEVTSLLSGQNRDRQKQALAARSLLATRFLPPPPTGKLIERPELLERLNECQHVKLLLLTAPAGFGKTTLLGQWCEIYKQQKQAGELAWITLDEGDNDPVRFWNAVWNALHSERERDLDFSIPLYSTPQMSLETILAALLNALKGQPNKILILDDYHLITNMQISEGMELLLSHLPGNMHIIISSRNEPSLALGRARMYGEMRELHIDDLRLSVSESIRFLREVANLVLSDEELAFLEQRTEGWIAGLYLAALALLQNDLGSARRALSKLGIDSEQKSKSVPTVEQADERFILARIWLAEGWYDKVVDLLEPVVKDARQRKHLRMVFLFQTLQAIALCRLGQHQQAAQLLHEVLSIAGPEGYMRTFLDLGEPLQELLQQVELGREVRGYARRLIESTEKSDPTSIDHAGLSEREYEVLQLVADGMSNQEIADTLIVALSTVKVHVRHICQKLDVQKRLQAVTRAREIGLL